MIQNVLVACEESQVITKEFRSRGIKAFSCDIVPCSGGFPEWHIQDDVLNVIDFKWDLIIAHPPCTRLCNSGQRWLYTKDPIYNQIKKDEQLKAIDFFLKFTDLKCDHVAIENPLGIMSTLYRSPDQIIQPHYFYPDTDMKTTCLWLKGLPKLFRNQYLSKELITQNNWKAVFNGKHYAWNDPEVARLRSKTYPGVAYQIASQWSYI